jgi:hypothetical protein
MKPNSRFRFTKFFLLCGALAALLLATSARSQQPPPQGALRFANACAIPGRTLVTVDNAKLRPDGFGPGENTGMIGILAGTHRFAATHPSAGKGDLSVTVQPNSFTTVVAYPKPAIDPLTKKTVQTLALFARADPPREKGKHFQILCVSTRPSINISVNGQPVSLAPLRELKADGYAKGSLKIEYLGKPVIDFGAEESGSFLVVLFDRPDGTIGGVLMPDYG